MQHALVAAAQIGLAILLGAAIGIERELAARLAGLRTHMLVALGSVVVTQAGHLVKRLTQVPPYVIQGQEEVVRVGRGRARRGG